MFRGRFGNFRSVLVNILLIILGLLIPILLLEAKIRFDFYRKHGLPLTSSLRSAWTAPLGWEGKEHVINGETTNTILVLGDSFTDGLGVESAKMWFAYLKERSPSARIIAYGGAGYSTLQELMILERYIEKGLKPSLIILQLCSNDITNNYLPLEKKSFSQRPPAPRPYFEKGLIQMHYPRENAWILLPLVGNSRVAERYNNVWDNMVGEKARQGKIVSVEQEILKRGLDLPEFKEGVAVTKALIEKIRERAGSVPLVMLLVDDLEPQTTVYKEIAKDLGLPLVTPSQLRTIPSSGRQADGVHLNEEGNKILGDSFVKSIRLLRLPQ